MLEAASAFHAHLDLCTQCRERPFDLCIEGGVLLSHAAHGLTEEDVLDMIDNDSLGG